MKTTENKFINSEFIQFFGDGEVMPIMMFPGSVVGTIIGALFGPLLGVILGLLVMFSLPVLALMGELPRHEGGYYAPVATYAVAKDVIALNKEDRALLPPDILHNIRDNKISVDARKKLRDDTNKFLEEIERRDKLRSDLERKAREEGMGVEYISNALVHAREQVKIESDVLRELG